MREEPGDPATPGRENTVASARGVVRRVWGLVGDIRRAPAVHGAISATLRARFGAHGMPRGDGVFFLHPDGKFSHLPRDMGHTDAILDALSGDQRLSYGIAADGDDGARGVFDLDKERIDSVPLQDAYAEGVVRGRLREGELDLCHHERGVTPAQEKAVDDVIAAHGVGRLSWDTVSGSGSLSGGSGVAAWKRFIHRL